MIIKFSEYEGSFCFEMEAETIQEAAAITRFAMNRTDNVRHASSTVSQDGTFRGAVVFGKSKRASNYVPKRK